jgi:hypothetical protein
MGLTAILETGAAALLFAATFLIGERVRPFKTLVSPRSIVSFGAGMAAAYVFMHMMPELHGVRLSFAGSMSAALPYKGKAVYFFALTGFLAFYGLDRLHVHAPQTDESRHPSRAFKFHVGGFAAYVWLIAYLLVRNIEKSEASTVLYAVAIAFHLLALSHELSNEYGAVYQLIGRFVLAAMALLGWATGLLFALPAPVLTLLLAFISGAVIMNSLVMELPSEKDGRFWAFMAGGLLYGLVLWPLG